MDLSLKPYTSTSAVMKLRPCVTDYTDCSSEGGSRILIDRLTTLPAELLIGILSLLPTKDAAAACVSFLTLMIPRLYLIVFEHYGIERFPNFVTFVDSVIRAYQSDYLTKFRLGIGPVDRPSLCSPKHPDDICKTDCFPDLKATQINAWISLPLTRCGLRELDFRIYVKEEGGMQLSSEIFTCEMLEVLKLNVNLSLDRVAAMPSFRLPNLKLLALLAIIIPEGDLAQGLFRAALYWRTLLFISISSPSLRRFCFEVWNEQTGVSSRDFVHIHAPKLEYLKFFDDLALRYSIANMDWLLEADICIHSLPKPMESSFEVSGQIMLSLIRPLYNVQRIVLNGECPEQLNYDKVKDQLPVFPNLEYLYLFDGDCGDLNTGSASDYESGDELVL
ncbi:hypothetical protein RDABS01_007275 [Bienertia sinuspersici]